MIFAISTKINPSIQSEKFLSTLKFKNLTPSSRAISLYCLYKVGIETPIFAKVDFKNLKSEELKSWEFGIESAMLKNRLSFDISLYQSNATNQIFSVPQSTSTGFAFSQINAGEMQNKGIEVSLFGSPVKTKDFEWQVGVNWSKNKNEVVSLNQGRDNLQLASWQGGVTLNATVGEAYGTMRGTDYVYDANGNKTVDADGHYLTASNKVIGNIQADWIGGVSNRITYKDFSLNFLIDMKKGGSVFSLDQS